MDLFTPNIRHSAPNNTSTNKMRITHTTRTINSYVADFSGREGMQGYDLAKPITIGDFNRDFVWTEERQQGFIKTILEGRPVPAIVICNNEVIDGGNRSCTLFRWCHDEFSVTIGEMTYTYSTMIQTQAIFANWHACQLSMTVISDATEDEKSQIFEDFNNPVNLTCGQLLWNRKHTPLVKAALQLIGQEGELPFQDTIAKVWRRRANKTKTRGELAFAIQIIVASQYGPAHFHKKFNAHRRRIMQVRDDELNLSNLQRIFERMDAADPDNVIPRRKKTHVFKKFIGAIIHDYHVMDDGFDWVGKWTEFLRHAYNRLTVEQINAICEVGVDRANNVARIGSVSARVQRYLDEHIVPEAEVGDTTDEEESDE